VDPPIRPESSRLGVPSPSIGARTKNPGWGSHAFLHVEDGRVRRVVEEPLPGETYLSPGFVDAHVHIESSLLVPSEFARAAVVHETKATVSHPHEIATPDAIQFSRSAIMRTAVTAFRPCEGRKTNRPPVGLKALATT